ncbi:MAG: trypsin-like peptidase domain-containing protein [Planctomycetes bacterium]|nr:trypsin-like peptidase domain-containing protein [Planctomycetota bacterium]
MIGTTARVARASGRLTAPLVLSAAALGLALAAAAASLSPRAPPAARAAAAGDDRLDALQPDERRVVDVFRDASRSVVFVSNNAMVRRSFFSRNVEEVPVGSGSGFVWDKAGHVITNYHVVAGDNRSITVTLEDGSLHRAQLVGSFPDRELAVLKIPAPAEKLHPIRIGRSGDLLVGQTALAIGNPFGLDHTLTVGVISALGREIRALTGRTIADVIQTDAAINPGSSGGPLLSSRGELIGMNTAILSPSGVNAGIGFAVPVDIVRRYVDQIIKHGKVRGAGLGVILVPDEWARAYRIQGVVIDSADRRGAAAKGGLRGTRVDATGEIEQLGDVITAIGGKDVRDLNGLRDELERHAVGEEVEVTFLRDGAQRKAKVILQEIELRAE